ncbi:aminoacyl-histidine dipeptidase [Ruminococcus sp. OA3]|uniref:aminoacyl-histidine dipeptidase n=1 Tax=Ruminococcus sp. OA3 TaxID=2914164 RepID=UPI001F05DC98|nr:aminoacyl-histidine dipeptidase [Ruminococcus sp. OA3]MCH1983545.1 aminoacyl-histidine dipeptidase [Ruminococcus sp. OA3]
MAVLEGLKPERVFYYFEKWCQIPHGSGHTEDVCRFLTDFAREHGLTCHVDDSDNVLIEKAAAPGYESAVPVIIQGHTDMVAEKTLQSKHDFEKDGLKLSVNGDYICAEETTLGADDGIAVAYALALLEDSKLKHPALEVLLTSNEEVGLLGAGQFDAARLKGKYLINIDSEEEGYLLVGCAGGVSVKCSIPVRYVEDTNIRYEIRVAGLKGGHSGMEIDKQRANANILMGRILFTLKQQMPFLIAEFEGGKKHNVIPNEARALVLADEENQEILKDTVSLLQKELRREYAGSDGDITLTVTNLGIGTEPVLHPVSMEKLLFFLMNQQNGVIHMSGLVQGMPQTSTNTAVTVLTPETFDVLVSIRSSVESEKYHVASRSCYLTEFLGGECELEGEYPAWEYQEESMLREIMCRTYEALFGKQPAVTTVHAGLECGLFKGKIDALDCISFGPDILDIHSVNERISISSVGRMWEYLLHVLKNIK